MSSETCFHHGVAGYYSNLDEIRKEDNFEAIVKLNYALGLMYKHLGEDEIARDYLKHVALRYEETYGRNHKKVKKVNSFLGDNDEE